MIYCRPKSLNLSPEFPGHLVQNSSANSSTFSMTCPEQVSEVGVTDALGGCQALVGLAPKQRRAPAIALAIAHGRSWHTCPSTAAQQSRQLWEGRADAKLNAVDSLHVTPSRHRTPRPIAMQQIDAVCVENW